MEKLPLTQFGIYNPGRLTDEQIEQLFTARGPLLTHIMQLIEQEQDARTPQHQLIVGPRGMGKSTFLRRVAAELRKEPYCKHFIPLTFAEEQYNVDRIEKLWLNCLDALADALELEGDTKFLDQIDKAVSRYRTDGRRTDPHFLQDEFEHWAKKINRKPVLLIDNMSLIFSGLGKEGQHALRQAIMKSNAPLVLGASVIRMKELDDHNAPFYDAFQVHTLPKLSFYEASEVLRNLALLAGRETVAQYLVTNPARLHALYDLTGGTPRTLALLFPLVQEGFSKDIRTDLDALLDIITPLYKARFDELAQQSQIILDAVALQWSPIDLEGLRNTTGLENHQLSPQLKRLIDTGWLRKLENAREGGKGKAYEMNERLFNVWYIMRRSSRRQRRELLCYSRFLETFYGESLSEIAENQIENNIRNTDDAFTQLALSEAINKSHPALAENLRNQLRENPIAGELIEEYENFLSGRVDSTYSTGFTKIRNTIIHNLKHWNSEKNIGIKTLQIEKFHKEIISVRGAIMIIDEDFFTSIKMLKSIVEKLPELAFAWSALGIAYLKNDQYNQAEIAYQRAIEVNPEDAFTWYGLGGLFQDYLERYKEAESAFREAIRINPTFSPAWEELGNLFQDHLGRYQEAEVTYRKAIEINPESEHAWNGLGNLFQDHLERYQEAEVAYRKAIEINPEFIYSWNGLGNLLQDHLGRYQEAEVAYRKAIEIDPEYVYAWHELGNLLQDHLGRYQEAEVAFRKAIEINPEYVYAWYGLGTLLQDNLVRLDEAEVAFLKTIEIKPKEPTPWNRLGNLLILSPNRLHEAASAFNKALKLGGSEVVAHNLVFLERDILGRRQVAEEIFDSHIKNEYPSTVALSRALLSSYSSKTGWQLHFSSALEIITKTGIPSNILDDWQRFAAVMLYRKLEQPIVEILEETGNDVTLRPYYEAIRAIASKSQDRYLLSIPSEMREVTGKIATGIQKVIDLLVATEHLRENPPKETT